MQAAIVRATATTRTKDPCRFAFDRVVFFFSKAVAAWIRENFMASNADIFDLHVLVDRRAWIGLRGREHERGDRMLNMRSCHRYIFCDESRAFDLNLLQPGWAIRSKTSCFVHTPDDTVPMPRAEMLVQGRRRER